MDLREREWTVSGQGPVEGSCGHGNEPSWVAERLLASQEGLSSMQLHYQSVSTLYIVEW
jgi:hypothetical protein